MHHFVENFYTEEILQKVDANFWWNCYFVGWKKIATPPPFGKWNWEISSTIHVALIKGYLAHHHNETRFFVWKSRITKRLSVRGAGVFRIYSWDESPDIDIAVIRIAEGACASVRHLQMGWSAVDEEIFVITLWVGSGLLYCILVAFCGKLLAVESFRLIHFKIEVRSWCMITRGKGVLGIYSRIARQRASGYAKLKWLAYWYYLLILWTTISNKTGRNIHTFDWLISRRRVVSEEVLHHGTGVFTEVCSCNGILGHVRRFFGGNDKFVDFVDISRKLRQITALTRVMNLEGHKVCGAQEH